MTNRSSTIPSSTTSDVLMGTAPDDSALTLPLLTVEQAAERLGTPVRFVRRLIAERRIRFCRIGRYVRIAPSDLATFIEAGRVEARDQGR